MLDALKKWWLAFLVLASLGYVLFRGLGQAHGLRVPVHVSAVSLAMTVAIQVVQWSVNSLLWRRLVRLSSGRRLSLMQSLFQMVLVTLGKYVPGKVWGMLLRGAHLARAGIGTREAATATLREQWFLLHASVVLSAAVLALLFPAAGTALLALAAIGSVLWGSRLQRTGERLLCSVLSRMTHAAGEARAQLATPPRQYAAFIGGFVLSWVCSGLVFASLYSAFFNTAPGARLLLALLLSNTVGMTIGFLALFAPGGIGVREAVSSAMLAHFMPLQEAVLLALLYRAWLVATDLLLGMVSVVALRRELIGARWR